MSVVVFFFKQKTAYEMRISDWSSDVCSSDLVDIGIVRDDEGGVPAQFQRHSLEALTGQRGQAPADRDGTGERQFPDDVGREQIFGDLVRHAEHDVERARGPARILEHPDRNSVGEGTGVAGSVDLRGLRTS